MQDYKTIIVEKRDRYAVITLNRPKVMNCVDITLAEELTDALHKLDLDHEVFGVILTGAGPKSFCSGDDVNDDWSAMPYNKSMAMRTATLFRQRMLTRIEEYSYPVIAAINGYCLGGGINLALACDLRIASENATFAMSELRLGFQDDWGGNKRLANCVGESKAKEIYFTGRRFGANEAKEMGLVSQVVPQDQLMNAAEDLMQQCLRNAPIATKLTKLAIRCGRDMTLQGVMELETMMDGIVIQSKDLDEGLKAFFEKREPKWTNY